MTDQERFDAAMDLVDRALDASDTEREQILAACPDSEVRREAKRLLAADASAGDALELPAFRIDRPLKSGDRVGAFQLEGLLGRGGMGEVWVADRVGADFAQRVALKLLPGSDTNAIARFRRERRILARLDHPNIAKLIDGGVTTDGRPWLAMELVDGAPLSEWCEGRPREACLKLFADVCDAVQFAHRNLVIHRDLKPANILVTNNGTAKLLDFGIAKLLAADDTDPELTRTRERPMTLEYASPEQLRNDEITIASDVWALGVCLFEILTGSRPYGGKGKSRPAVEAEILEARPIKPSSRGTPELRGDLDAICVKALRANPADRYPSPEALAGDLRAHLAHAPVSARGDSTSYLFRTMVRRHRAVFAVVMLALVLAIAGITGTVWQARRAKAQARKAERSRELVIGIIEQFDPDRAGDKPFTQSAVLQRGEDRLKELDDDPEDQARLLLTFAQVWYRSGAALHALPLALRAITEERILDPQGMRLEELLDLAGNCEFELGAYDIARHYLDEARALAEQHHDDKALAVVLNDIAGVLRKQQRYSEAEPLRRQALAIDRVALGENDQATIGVENDLAVLLGDEGNYTDARAMQVMACDAMRATIGATHPDTLTCRGNVVRLDVELDPKRALDEVNDVIATEEKIFGADWGDLPRLRIYRAKALAKLTP
ncbi:MAG: serine/threonine-protein kinase [Kofleriaceae bacterium]